jgi:hypothetical protein
MFEKKLIWKIFVTKDDKISEHFKILFDKELSKCTG